MANDALDAAKKALASANKFEASNGGPMKGAPSHITAPYSAVAASHGVKAAAPASDAASAAGQLGKEVDARRAMEDAARTQ